MGLLWLASLLPLLATKAVARTPKSSPLTPDSEYLLTPLEQKRWDAADQALVNYMKAQERVGLVPYRNVINLGKPVPGLGPPDADGNFECYGPNGAWMWCNPLWENGKPRRFKNGQQPVAWENGFEEEYVEPLNRDLGIFRGFGRALGFSGNQGSRPSGRGSRPPTGRVAGRALQLNPRRFGTRG